jgi:hypothetical protein
MCSVVLSLEEFLQKSGRLDAFTTKTLAQMKYLVHPGFFKCLDLVA